MEHRKCRRCGETKPLTSEYWHYQGKGEKKKLRLICKKCSNKQNRNAHYGIYADYKEEVKKVKFIMKTQKSKFPFTSYASMTKDKVYDVIMDDCDCYTLKDDTGKVVRLSKARFKKATIDEILRSEFE